MQTRVRRLLAGVIVAFTVVVAPAAFAQVPTPIPIPYPSGAGNAAVAASHAVIDAGTRFLRQLANEAASLSTGAPSINNPFGGGADLQSGADQPAAVARRWRVWSEGYGLRSRMDADATFAGDRRETFGGVAGLGVAAAPGLSFGLSVDHGRTKVDLPAAIQNASIDLTQIGANVAIESGAWTLALAAVHGIGDTDMRRGDSANPSLADYDTKLWGALAELSYLWSRGNWRVVPKAGFDWSNSRSDAFAESGGSTPILGSEQRAERSRLTAAVEIGHTWFADRNIIDLAGYVRAVEIVSLDRGSLTVTSQTGAFTPNTIPGVSESRFGIDAGASFSWRFSPLTRVYAMYDGRFRSNFEAHAGILGVEFKW